MTKSPILPAPPPTLIRVPEGTRDVLPREWSFRAHLTHTLQSTFDRWGYQGVSVPALELQNAAHPRDARAFKLIDRDGAVLSLRSEFTTAIGRLVRTRFPSEPYPLRLQYEGKLWLRSQDSDMLRLREFTQLGVELVGISSARADAELLSLATAALDSVGLTAHLEVGFPGFVDAVLEDADVSGEEREALHEAIDRKAMPEVQALLRERTLSRDALSTVLALPELYGGPDVLTEARKLPLGPNASAALDRLDEIAARYGRALLFDLGMSRRYTYYTGFTFRAYAEGAKEPIVSGGRYDAGIPGAGFALGLERLTFALGGPPAEAERVLALDEASAAWARARGVNAELAWTEDAAELLAYARARGISRVVRDEAFEPVEALS
ncbi:ATP phosphoribosyltransferase regulatory subunit [Deinococcus yavapaiensis]|uniref:ATP phosphoribosyltransferase regulatory subunit n=1 Tax=Deinococcus yavapaiensis KR-236 TaxID=694435 RepID=A0A318S6U1_9DEIO|nr:ATP phosphoribosyltransferase regulatory subunit [Deinococcus yavapaiensis]PYE53359.1 ATP phosphoribosyltransferase regulatory subunit [Deinococcus yavapaiensis KR-236]